MGYDDGSAIRGDYSNYGYCASTEKKINTAMYNDNASLLFHLAYGFDAQVTYGQFSPLASPISLIMIDGHLY
ncbi:hypothetical protein Hanom_Chr11g01003751 [Helianthus anomalus]